ncbi:hypothetical protein ES705_29237 [subsurface metagenome]
MMVKITNLFGDIKTGKQGEAVYQRKYGEQIRRQVSPKRAIPSERQIKHRQLYKDALDWRKSLSRANRRYLEGYCIAGGIVDGYGAPLAWSRFALKLYLEKVKFIPDLWTEVVSEQSGVWEYYHDPTNASNNDVYDKYYEAQTFTPQYGYPIVKVGIKGWRFDSVEYTATIGIKATDGNGLPTGDFKTSATFGSHLFKSDPPPEWQTIDLPPFTPTANVKYALVLGLPSAGTGDRLVWAGKYPGTYPGGNQCHSSDYGVTWIEFIDWGLQFDIYQFQAATSKKLGILHVRHPSLLTVVQKREGLTIKGYDTLSSLNDEYLTKQVGLDVFADDIIEATTLPGIEFKYQVR